MLQLMFRIWTRSEVWTALDLVSFVLAVAIGLDPNSRRATIVVLTVGAGMLAQTRPSSLLRLSCRF
jgi:hypothetical protein